MAKITLVQENGDIAMAINNLMKINGTNKTKFCKKHKLNYILIYKQINANGVDLDFLKDLIHKIDPKAKLSVDISISLTANGKDIFKQITEK